MGPYVQFHTPKSIYLFNLNVTRVMKVIKVKAIRTGRSTTLVDNEPYIDAAKDMAVLTGISEVGKGECD
jgi:hypothetical protein